MAIAAGLGGGTVVMMVMVLLFGMDYQMAVPISNFCVFCSTTTKSLKEIWERHPDKTQNKPLIDWNLSILFIIPVVFGTTLGVYVSMLVSTNTMMAVGSVFMFILGVDAARKCKS